MIKIKHCKKCNREYDSILPKCPHCIVIEHQSSKTEKSSDNSSLNQKETARQIESSTFGLTPSGDGVQVDFQTAQLHPSFGVIGGLLYFKLALVFCPLLGLIYSLSQSAQLLKTDSGALIYSCILDSFIFIWAYWLSKELYKYEKKTANNINKYLIVAAAIGITSAYIGSKLNNSQFINSSTLILIQSAKLIGFSLISAFYIKSSNQIKITYHYIIKKGDPFFAREGITVNNLPDDRAWLAHAKEFSNLTKDTLASNHKTLANFPGRNETENITPTKSVGSYDVEKFSLRIAALKNALNEGLITKQDYEKKKKQILDEL